MTAPTQTVQYLLAQAGVRVRAGAMHIVSQRDTGALNPVCGANPVRSREIHTWTHAPADLTALCADCAALAEGLPGIETVEQGLAVFIGTTGDASTTRLLHVPVGTIAAPVARPADADLIDSVALHGVIQPVLARRTPTGLELIAGSRRLAAARAAGHDTIPAVVRDADDETAILARLTENLHRLDLNPIAQAHSYQDALDTLGITQKALADRLAISAPQVSNTLRLLELPLEVQQHIASGALGAAHARELLRLTDPEDQAALAAQIVTEGLTVRETAARRAATSTAATPQRADLSELLQGLRDARLLVTFKSNDRARITIDVLQADVEALLGQLERSGIAA